MVFEAFERGLWGTGYRYALTASQIRLGYEIVCLADDQETRETLRVSPRVEQLPLVGHTNGIGIDSDFQEQFMPQQLEDALKSDYHTWSTFDKLWTYWGMLEPHKKKEWESEELRVLCLVDDEFLGTLDGYVDKAIFDREGNVSLRPTRIPREQILVEASGRATSEHKIKALMEDPEWRHHAKSLCRKLLQYQREKFNSERDKVTYGLADIMAGERILKTARPTVDAIDELFALYASQMQE